MTVWETRPDDFVRQDFTDVVFLYDRLSGDTHALSPFASALLGLVSEAPKSTSELITMLPQAFGLAADDFPDGAINTWIDELDALGLLRPVGTSA